MVENNKKSNNSKSLDKMVARESNKLVYAMPLMDWRARKLFDLAIANIPQSELTEEATMKNGQLPISVSIRKDDVYSFFGLESTSSSSKYTRLKKSLSENIKHAQFIINNGEGIGNIFMDIHFGKPSDPNISIRLHPDLRPYVASQKQGYNKFQIIEEKDLHGDSIFLYKRIDNAYNIYEQYVGTNKRTSEQLDELRNPYFTMDELTELFNKVGKYERPYDLVRYVVNKAVKDINDHTKYDLELERIRESKFLVGLRFHITKKFPHDIAGPNFFGLSEEEEKILNDDSKLQVEFMQSPYTKLLADNHLIAAADMFNADLIREIYSQVYPYYKEIAALGNGLDAVSKHISYVATFRDTPDKKGNITKYLVQSAEDYLRRLQANKDTLNNPDSKYQIFE